MWQHAESFSKALNGRPNWCMAMPLQGQQDVAPARAYFSVGHVTASLYWRLLIPRWCVFRHPVADLMVLPLLHGRMLASSMGRRNRAREEKNENGCFQKNWRSYFCVIGCVLSIDIQSRKIVKMTHSVDCFEIRLQCVVFRVQVFVNLTDNVLVGNYQYIFFFYVCLFFFNTGIFCIYYSQQKCNNRVFKCLKMWVAKGIRKKK